MFPITPSNSKYLIVIAGPTAVGKTTCCIQLAKHLQTEIISADARQCYQGMTIGTAQPTLNDMQGVPHHLINFLPVHMPYNAQKFSTDALNVLSRLFEKYDYVLMTGGAGLYIRAVCEGLHAIPSVDPTIRAMLRKKLHTEGLPPLLKTLAKKDPLCYQTIDRANPQRVIRALEVCIATGKPYSTWLQSPRQIPFFRIVKIGLHRARSVLYKRINQRVLQMLAQGLIEEVKTLAPYRHYNALRTVGYREIFGYLDGCYGLTEAIGLIQTHTRQYAKRQLTWFRQDNTMPWYCPEDITSMLHYIRQTSPTKHSYSHLIPSKQ